MLLTGGSFFRFDPEYAIEYGKNVYVSAQKLTSYTKKHEAPNRPFQYLPRSL